MNIGILNVTGYAGLELVRILTHHPHARIVSVTGRSEAGKALEDVFPHLNSLGLTIQPEIGENVDVLFSALPHKTSANTCAHFLKNGVKVIDISADFRLKNLGDYEEWYNVKHPCPEYLVEAVYGLTELHRNELPTARLVANPGCYATGAILALAPAVKAGIITPDIIVDSKSGVSGAGRSLALSTHFSEVNESVAAYSTAGHRHLPEITQELGGLSPASLPRITFLPHLIPMTRGILSSCYAPIKEKSLSSGKQGIEELLTLYHDFYRTDPFVTVTRAPLATKHTLGSNFCSVSPTIDLRTGRLQVVSCLDNLIKGAAGQAVQNMNVLFNLPETEGLEALALYP
jgi:N-acetyl-gamma-glutamyl-phosphate reductase